MTTQSTFPREAADVTPKWLSSILGGTVETVSCEQIGIGVGLLGRLYRLALTGAGVPSSVILKLPTLDVGARTNVVEPLRFYEKEIAFYRETSGSRCRSQRHPCFTRCSTKSRATSAFFFEDLGTRRMEDPDRGLSAAGRRGRDRHARRDARALVEQRRFPAWLPQYSDPPYPQVIAGMFMQSWPRAVEVLGDHLTPRFRDFGERYPELVPWFMENLSAPPFTLCHGDFRLDNLFFGAEDSASRDHGCRLADLLQRTGRLRRRVLHLAEFADRRPGRRNEQALKNRYLAGLKAHGITYADFEADYAKTVAHCFIYAVVTAGQIEPTNDRMVQLILSILDRAVAAIEDSKALDLLPS